jgi:hypothetical protein
MKAFTIFNDDISLKLAIGYMCTTMSEQYRLSSLGERDKILRVIHMGY